MTKELLEKIANELADIKAMKAEGSLIDMTKTEQYIEALNVAVSRLGYLYTSVDMTDDAKEGIRYNLVIIKQLLGVKGNYNE